MISSSNLVLFCFLVVGLVSGDQFADVVNKKVYRVIDISSQLVTITCRVALENNGKTPVDNYLVTFEDDHRPHLSYMEARLIENEKTKVTLGVTKITDKDGQEAWQIDLGDYKIQPGSLSELIEFEAVFTHLLQPFPTQILQSERQLVMYTGNHYFYSPYASKTQQTKIKLPHGSLESYTKLKLSSTSDQAINYGPYDNIAPRSFSKMQIHYENNAPFLTVTRLERSVEVSHWAGVISIEEVVDIRHDGALLKGSFSRYEFQREPTNGISAVKSFKTKLPGSAFDIYYRDDIGNISTSNLRTGPKTVIADLRPRFPLFGGWKTHYILGYYVPTRDYLFNEGNRFVLRIPFVDHVFDNNVIDEAVVNIILPEGASNIKLQLPFTVTREKDQVYKTYLDTVGRAKIVLKKNNLVEDHIQELEIHYTFNKIWMLQEPLLIVAALTLLCLLVIIYVRLDFSLTKNPAKESSFKVSGLVETILSIHSKRTNLYTKFDQASIKYKASKDEGSFHTSIKQLSADLKQESTSISDLISRMKSEGASSDVMDKVNELQRLDKTLREQLQQQRTLVEKLVAGKISKQLYLETDSNITKKKAEIAEKMVAITSVL